MPKNRSNRPMFLRGLSALTAIVVLGGTFAATAGAAPEQLKVKRMGGDIDYAEVPDGGELETMGGNIHVGKAHHDITLTSMGGNIGIDSADGAVKATTMGGNITIGWADDSVNATTMGGSIEAKLVKGQSAGAHEIKLTSMGGEIVLTVPKDYPMTVDVTLAYTKKNEGKYKITQTLGLEQSTSSDWDYSHGTARKYLRAKGRVGDGQNHVTINTIDGNVIIKGERSQL